MKIEDDKTIDARYVRIKKGQITHTKKERDWLLFDCAANGDVLGVEILDFSKHPVSIFTVGKNFFGCSLIKSKPLGKDQESLGLTVDSPEHEKDSQFAFA
ncbi:hypothetical protein A3A05_00130 [Candidatus Nomurabacteria bacterium RIFCSPLOWO2_01_FULL_41_12]|uniref:DUF2283 domain-containing protein n=1 Tax=Candidatus Nomurabacteria bacterium RIFCSPLOWO2_01_FULL_41_12 TaxID=1801774 RepID=A0A1F6WXB1_9BACT|nr:MAG: hypothetical protein A2732_01155 [Candidatus Nomurabacteria bacterium RIFCSPHIGHO2_01_FULL_40_10]OGI86521.1 MAG: hypothetical protein A3A05_00130 [Candidatus Nomurabacteria bacterium RIFCSPLOWO2_01_FULL_41_12]